MKQPEPSTYGWLLWEHFWEVQELVKWSILMDYKHIHFFNTKVR